MPPPSTIIMMPRWNGNDLPPSEHSRWARQRARNAALLLQNEVSYGGKAWRRASQLCTDPERARASKVRRRVHRYQHKIACTAVKYGGNGEVGSILLHQVPRVYKHHILVCRDRDKKYKTSFDFTTL